MEYTNLEGLIPLKDEGAGAGLGGTVVGASGAAVNGRAELEKKRGDSYR